MAALNYLQKMKRVKKIPVKTGVNVQLLAIHINVYAKRDSTKMIVKVCSFPYILHRMLV